MYTKETEVVNKVILMGRLTRDPEVRYSQAAEPIAIARFTLAIDRKVKQEGMQAADFINCVAFGKNGEFAEKYLRKGIKIAVIGRIQTGSYTNKDGAKVYTTDIVVEEFEFAESKGSSLREEEKEARDGEALQGYGRSENGKEMPPAAVDEYGFMNIPDGIDEELPFN